MACIIVALDHIEEYGLELLSKSPDLESEYWFEKVKEMLKEGLTIEEIGEQNPRPMPSYTQKAEDIIDDLLGDISTYIYVLATPLVKDAQTEYKRAKRKILKRKKN